jgi:hypothetical protein
MALAPRFVDGIDHYCDAWCSRCPGQRQCQSFAHRIREREPPEPPPAMLTFLQVAGRPLTNLEQAKLSRQVRREQHRRRSHPLTRRALRYADVSTRALTALERPVVALGDSVVLAAFESASRFPFAIAVKTSRAVSDLDGGGRFTHARAQPGANGTAKLVRLMIAESIDAWDVLRHALVGGDGNVSATMIAQLSELDAELAETFPQAMAFVRPGLDR